MPTHADDLETLYRVRFAEAELTSKYDLWKTLCQNFFQQFIPNDAVVLDVGCGYCEFINNIECKKKFALDLNPESKNFANPGIEFVLSSSTDLSRVANDSIDRVFLSNFLEHLKSKQDVLSTLAEIFRVLTPGGKILILQPNIRFLYKEYWDFFDHHTPLSDRSLTEALQILGFKIEKVIPKFLPYTTKSRFPKSSFWVKLYLQLSVFWRLFGKQAFLLARKP